MRYNINRDTNEMEHRANGEREVVNSGDLELFLGDDNYMNKVEEMLLDVLNRQYDVSDAINDVREHTKEKLGL